MNQIVKVLLNGRVVSAIVSAVSAIICAYFAGCRLVCSQLEMQVGTWATNVVNSVIY